MIAPISVKKLLIIVNVLKLPHMHACDRKIRKSASRREVRRVVGPSSGSSWQLYVTTIYLYMLGTTNTLSMLFQVLRLWLLVHLKERIATLLRSSCI